MILHPTCYSCLLMVPLISTWILRGPLVAIRWLRISLILVVPLIRAPVLLLIVLVRCVHPSRALVLTIALVLGIPLTRILLPRITLSWNLLIPLVRALLLRIDRSRI